jgi:hypothetical protein
MENRLYSIVNRLYVAMCGFATGILGFFGNVDSNIHLILVLEGGTLGAFIVFAAFCSSLALLAELVRTEIFHKRALKHRHLLFVAVAFCWLCLLFLGVNRPLDIPIHDQIFKRPTIATKSSRWHNNTNTKPAFQ